MVDFLYDDARFEGEVTFEGEVVANGGLAVGAQGLHYGEPPSGLANTWRVAPRIRVANVAERNALVAWRNANAPISKTNPLQVWRADGSWTGLDEMTFNGTDWIAESPRAGDIKMTLGSEEEYGWVKMYGQTLTNAATNYPALWAIADPVLRVGSGLRIPDMRGRSPLGAGNAPGLSVRNLGDLLGEEAVTLTESTLPNHGHTGTTQTTDRSLNHNHWFRMSHDAGSPASGSGGAYFEKHNAVDGGIHYTSNVSETVNSSTGAGLGHLHPFVTNKTGGGNAHNNMHPSGVVSFRVKL